MVGFPHPSGEFVPADDMNERIDSAHPPLRRFMASWLVWNNAPCAEIDVDNTMTDTVVLPQHALCPNNNTTTIINDSSSPLCLSWWLNHSAALVSVLHATPLPTKTSIFA
jgi:hypothetical protein